VSGSAAVQWIPVVGLNSTVWATVSMFEKTTVSPTVIDTDVGLKPVLLIVTVCEAAAAGFARSAAVPAVARRRRPGRRRMGPCASR
jgi:hypothetical protein